MEHKIFPISYKEIYYLIKDVMAEVQDDYDMSFPPARKVIRILKQKGYVITKVTEKQIKEVRKDVVYDINHFMRGPE